MRNRRSKFMATPELEISTEKVCFIIQRAREFAAKDVTTEPRPASNAPDDRMIAVLEEHAEDNVLRELFAYIEGLNVDEKVILVALTRLGRGDGTIEQWPDLVAQARAEANERTGRYLLGMPLLADYLSDGLGAFGLTCSE